MNIHHRNLQKLMTEIFKVKTILPTKNFPFQVVEDPCNKIWHRNTSYLGPKLWNLVPNESKTIEPLPDFKAKLN